MTEKIHDITDGNGHEINFAHDIAQAKNLINSAIHKGISVLGDKTYDSDKIIKYIEFESAKTVISARKNCKENREYNKEIYKDCNQVKQFFNKIKQYRRISTRYDKLVISLLSFIQLASTLIVLPNSHLLYKIC